MDANFFEMFETRAWTALFVVAPFIGVTVFLCGLAAAKQDRPARDRFWRPITVLAEFASALGVIAAIATTAQYFVQNDNEKLRQSLVQASAKRQGSAFVVGLTACVPLTLSGASFKQLSALSQLCALSRVFSQPSTPSLDEAISALGRYAPLPANVSGVLSPQVEALSRSLRAEIETRRQLHIRGLQVRTRPGESDWLVITIAAGVLLGVTLKFSRALSEWWHRRDEG